MEPLVMILVPGLLGGVVVALVVLLHQRRVRPAPLAAPRHLEPISPHLINMASIKVAGIGGLGLVAMSLAVSIGVPRIGQTQALGLALGAIAAAIVIVRRRRTGAMPSSGQGLGANVTLRIDEPVSSAGGPDPSNGAGHSFAPVPTLPA